MIKTATGATTTCLVRKHGWQSPSSPPFSAAYRSGLSVSSAQVSSNYHAGRYEEAERASKNAGKWTKISFFCGLAVYLIYILIYAIAGVSILSLAALDY